MVFAVLQGIRTVKVFV
jgi:hypothetical protein